jgi:hypothetical protein
VRKLALIAAAAILLLQLLAVFALAGRPLHYDENEYMHAAWMMAAGKRLYRDFFEDHPPHLFLMVQSLAGDADLRGIDVRAWAIRARLLSGALGTLAVAAVGLFAWRMTRAPAAPIVAVATVLASSQIWARGLADIRAEAPTLALFWIGAVLLIWNRDGSRAQALRAGTGIGLMVVASVWNPKWPLECAVMGGYFVYDVWRSRRTIAVAPAAIVSAIGFLPLVTVTTPADYFFFNFRFKAAVVGDFATNPWIVNFFELAPMWTTAAPQHRWWWVVAAMVIAVIAMRVWKPAEPRLAWLALGLCVAALLEVRFVYPYPYLWAQYLVMVAMTASLVYALVAALLPQRVQIVVLVAAVLFAGIPLWRKAFTDVPPAWAAYWQTQRAMQTSLGANDRVWISPPRHPVAALDASYYWYNFRESTPSAIRLRASYPEFLPPIGFTDLPPCRLQARYVELGDWMPFLDGVCMCAQNAFNSGRLSATPALGIFAVDAPPRDEPWLRRTRGLWSDLCRRQEVFLRGGQLNITP